MDTAVLELSPVKEESPETVIAPPFSVVYVAAPNTGVINVGVLERTTDPVPVTADNAGLEPRTIPNENVCNAVNVCARFNVAKVFVCISTCPSDVMVKSLVFGTRFRA